MNRSVREADTLCHFKSCPSTGQSISSSLKSRKVQVSSTVNLCEVYVSLKANGRADTSANKGSYSHESVLAKTCITDPLISRRVVAPQIDEVNS